MNTIHRRRRVIISATCFADANAAIAIATRLAQKIEGDILGLLIEDESILRYAELPFAKALAFHAGTWQPTTSPVTSMEMSKAFQHDAVLFELNLSKAARAASLAWSFERKRGQTMPLLHSAASKGDFILLGYQQIRPSRGEIICVDIADTVDANQLELGEKLARDMDIPLHTITLITSENEAMGGSSGLQKSGFALDHGMHSSTSRFNRGELLAYLRKASPTAVFVTARLVQDTDINAIREAARCPVVLSVQKCPVTQ